MEIEIFQPAPKKAYIYKLVDPRDMAVRYIGMTINPHTRLADHISGLYTTEAKSDWIAELKRLGLTPRMFVIDECDARIRFKRENQWISHFRAAGACLVNVGVSPARPRGKTWLVPGEDEMTTQEVLDFLCISRPTLFAHVKSKKLQPLPPENPNRLREPLRFRRADVEALDRRPSPAPPAPGQGTGLPGSGVKREE